MLSMNEERVIDPPGKMILDYWMPYKGVPSVLYNDNILNVYPPAELHMPLRKHTGLLDAL